MHDIKYKLIQMVWYNADKHVFLNKDRDWTLLCSQTIYWRWFRIYNSWLQQIQSSTNHYSKKYLIGMSISDWRVFSYTIFKEEQLIYLL